jgi:hypothetical protein
MFVDDAIHGDITFPNWCSRTEQSRIAILGKSDHALLKHFYDRIEERNRYLISRRGFNWTELQSLNRRCLQAMSQAFTGISWIKEFVPEMDSLLSQAKKKAGLS